MTYVELCADFHLRKKYPKMKYLEFIVQYILYIRHVISEPKIWTSSMIIVVNLGAWVIALILAYFPGRNGCVINTR